MCAHKHATASVLCTDARLTPVAMETELHSQRQPAAKDGVCACVSVRVCGGGLLLLLLWGLREERKNFFTFSGKPKEMNEGGFSVASTVCSQRKREYESSHICYQ